jgi:hypothetical protein
VEQVQTDLTKMTSHSRGSGRSRRLQNILDPSFAEWSKGLVGYLRNTRNVVYLMALVTTAMFASALAVTVSSKAAGAFLRGMSYILARLAGVAEWTGGLAPNAVAGVVERFVYPYVSEDSSLQAVLRKVRILKIPTVRDKADAYMRKLLKLVENGATVAAADSGEALLSLARHSQPWLASAWTSVAEAMIRTTGYVAENLLD